MRANTSRALGESKRNRNPPCNVAARGRQTCRRRESLGTDSLVLRRERPFNASINAFGAKFFCVAGLTAAASACAKKFPRNIAVVSNFPAIAKIVTAKKPLIHRHFCMTSIFAQDIARAENLAQRRCTDDAVARRLRKPDRAVTHKI
jgi:hypothetical protein